MWRWALYVGIGVAAIVLVAGVVGLLLPRTHEARGIAEFRASPAAVFAVVSDFAAYPEWRTGVTAVEVARDTEGTLVTEHGPAGVIPYRIERLEPPSTLVMRIADPNLGFGGTWTFTILPNDSGSELILTENGEVGNPFFRVMSTMFFSPTETIETYLADLRTRLGESPKAPAR